MNYKSRNQYFHTLRSARLPSESRASRGRHKMNRRLSLRADLWFLISKRGNYQKGHFARWLLFCATHNSYHCKYALFAQSSSFELERRFKTHFPPTAARKLKIWWRYLNVAFSCILWCMQLNSETFRDICGHAKITMYDIDIDIWHLFLPFNSTMKSSMSLSSIKRTILYIFHHKKIPRKIMKKRNFLKVKKWSTF